MHALRPTRLLLVSGGLLAALLLVALPEAQGGGIARGPDVDSDTPAHAAPANVLAPSDSTPVPGEFTTAETRDEARGSEHGLLERIHGVLPGGRISGDWAVVVTSLEHGDTLYARNADLPLAPASNVKLLTSAAALHYLGADFRFPTFVLAKDPVKDGVLQGDLVLYGTGDPALSDRFHEDRTTVFEELAEALRARGIERIEGDVIGDGSFFQTAGVPDSWDPSNFGNAYSAPASALSFNENVVTLRIGAGPVDGSPARIRTIPEGVEVSLANRGTSTSGRAWPPLTIERGAFEDPIQVEGRIRVGAPEAWRVIPVGDPARYAASAFRHVLESRGIRVAGGVRSVYEEAESELGRQLHAPGFEARAAHPRVLAAHRSPPLLDLLEVLNKRSNNLFAELVLLTLGQVVGSDGTFEGGTEVVRGFLEREVGLDVSRIRLEDGSGLSRDNRVSARDFVALLSHMNRSAHAEAFWSTLPEAGNARELRRMYRSAAAGNLRAKTGTIRRASALSGRVRTADGEAVAFSILGNGMPSRSGFKRIEDRIGIELANFSRPAGSLPARGAGEEMVASEAEDEGGAGGF